MLAAHCVYRTIHLIEDISGSLQSNVPLSGKHCPLMKDSGDVFSVTASLLNCLMCVHCSTPPGGLFPSIPRGLLV